MTTKAAPRVEYIYVKVGERIRMARELRGLTQGELGLRLNPPVTRAAIANMEAAKQRILLHVLAGIAEVLRFPLAAMIGKPR